MPSNASHAVLGTTELLEQILYSLPTIDLLHAQAVCKTWKAAIAGSLKLQQALFFKPIAIKDTRDCPVIFQHTATLDLPSRPTCPTHLWNPLLSSSPYILILPGPGPETDRLEDIVEVCVRPEASLGRMLLCQPAITCMKNGNEHDWTPNRDLSDTITNPNGITMGDVYGAGKGILYFILPIPGFTLEGWAELEDNGQLEEMKERVKMEGCRRDGVDALSALDHGLQGF